jgi:hypothetical protein
MSYVQNTKHFTPVGWAIIATTICTGLIVEAQLRSVSNLRSVMGAVLSVSILVLGLNLALHIGQKK